MAVNNLKTTKWRHLVQVFDYAAYKKNQVRSNKLQQFGIRLGWSQDVRFVFAIVNIYIYAVIKWLTQTQVNQIVVGPF